MYAWAGLAASDIAAMARATLSQTKSANIVKFR
jgi:hypothetical protein